MPSDPKGKKVFKRRERSWRGKITERFPYAKFLKLFLYNKWFAFSSVLIAFICLSVAVVIPKFFRVTPPHMDEVEKRSLLDFMQAHQLHKSADNYAERGDMEEAISAYAQSIQQNPGNEEYVRQFVGYLLENDNGSQYIGQSVNFGRWLLKLSQTNSNDAVLISKIYNKYGFPSETLKLLEPIQTDLDELTKVEYVKALFENQKLEEFLAEYHKLDDKLKASEKIKPLYLAYTAAFNKGEEASSAGLADLMALVEASPTNSELIRLLYLVAAIKEDIPLMESTLDRLTEINADRPQHHHGLWITMSNNGRLNEAKEKAQLYPYPPYTASGLVSQYQTLIKLGLTEMADQYAANHIANFGYVSQPWLVVCNSLLERAEWEQLGNFAQQMLSDNRVLAYSFYAHYFIGKSHTGLYRFSSATQSFNNISPLELASDDSALIIVRDLNLMGYSPKAKELLTGMQDLEKWNTQVEFWRTFFQAGWNTRDLDVCLKSSYRLYELDPTNLQDAFNYAGCLIAERQRPTEALVRTKDLYDKNPSLIPAKINYALALLLNDQLAEADNILNIEIDESVLNPSLHPSYYLAQFELNIKRENYDEAIAIYPKIKRDELYQQQQRWAIDTHNSIQNIKN